MKIILSTCEENESYIDSCVTILGPFWPKCPQVIVFSNYGNFLHPTKVICERSGWVDLNRSCLAFAVANRLSDPLDRVLFLLEDHMPLKPFDVRAVLAVEQLSKRLNARYINICGHGKDKLRQEPDSIKIFTMASQFQFTLHPSIWSANYLQASFDFAKNGR